MLLYYPDRQSHVLHLLPADESISIQVIPVQQGYGKNLPGFLRIRKLVLKRFNPISL